jgi:hypothetical protein
MQAALGRFCEAEIYINTYTFSEAKRSGGINLVPASRIFLQVLEGL